ncbi:Tetratricopeptide repeat protein 27 [Hondaea fermentalgiana]|uniref:Tetratricopeptide repeat protein 27 n=1 Tax=Hondaea fermentalgiana TaxID=2315210 RepID=A0A2R5GGN0_9STRA|nr:Tetratricopeptide repeat protein 27 [Hondaea fermentalgiana]|eukprot:GBG30030.1 Tetratricopeptide repeat protein 27 [Hondaea fermentalgiana]
MANLADLANAAAELSAAGKYAEAVEKYDEIIAINDGIGEIFLNRGVSMYKDGDFSGAAKSFKRAAELKPELTMAFPNLGNAYRELGRHKKAAEAYRRAVDDDPDNLRMWHNLATELTAAEEYEAAIDAAEEGISHASETYPPLHNARIVALFKIDRVMDSLEDIEAILEVSPMGELSDNQREVYSMVLSRKGYELMEAGNAEEAISYLERACEGDSSDANLYTYGVCLIQLGKDDEGTAALEESLAVNDSNWRAHVALGTVALRKREFEAAVEHFETAMSLDERPRKDSTINFNYAVALLNLGREEEAKEPLELVIAEEPDNHVARGLLGTILINEKDFGSAVDVLEQAVGLEGAKEDSSIHYNLGYARLMLDKPDEALESFEEALEINPESQQAQAAVESLRGVVGSGSSGGNDGEVSLEELLEASHSRSAAPILSEAEMRDEAAKARNPIDRIKVALSPERPEFLRRRSMEGIRAGYVLALAEVYDEMTQENLRN